MFQKRSLGALLLELSCMLITIMVYRPKLSVFSFSCRFTQVIQNTTKRKGAIFRMIYRYHDVFISIYRTLNGAPPENEHRVSKKEGMPPINYISLIKFKVSTL